MANQIFGDRWKHIRPINEGGQAHIFEVEDLTGELSEIHILKRLKNICRIERFKQEIEAGKNLDHPQIAPIVDYELSGKPYFVTKKYPGPTLAELSRLHPLLALEIFIGICDAVSYAHSKGIVHRDIKPENIILDKNSKPVILDFGICYFMDGDNRLTGTTEQVGSRYFIAPELEQGRASDVSFAADSYSLGKVLYYLLCGEKFPRENYTDSRSLSKLLSNSQLDYITQRILDKSVTEQPEMRIPVSDLKNESEKVKRLIYEHFYPGKDGSRCRFCGEGTYMVARYGDLNYSAVKLSIRKKTENGSVLQDLYFECEIIVCDTCGNLQYFKKM